MYTKEQLHAIDFLLKRITNDSSFALYKKNIKFVAQIDGKLWYGDFIQFKDGVPYRLFIDDSGDIEEDRFYATGSSSAAVLSEIWETYVRKAKQPERSFWNNPFRRMTELPLLFENLIKILSLTEIPDDCSPFYPYLLNACSIDGKLSLPFLDYSCSEIKLVSLIDLTEPV